MEVTELLTQIYNEAKRMGIDLKDFGIHSDEDLIAFALSCIAGDVADFFDQDTLDMWNWNPDEENSGEDVENDMEDLDEINQIIMRASLK